MERLKSRSSAASHPGIVLWSGRGSKVVIERPRGIENVLRRCSKIAPFQVLATSHVKLQRFRRQRRHRGPTPSLTSLASEPISLLCSQRNVLAKPFLRKSNCNTEESVQVSGFPCPVFSPVQFLSNRASFVKAMHQMLQLPTRVPLRMDPTRTSPQRRSVLACQSFS
jgi:hypothetical protein